MLKETSGGKVIPLRESYLKEFPEELKNHGAYLGKSQSRGCLTGGGQGGGPGDPEPSHTCDEAPACAYLY